MDDIVEGIEQLLGKPPSNEGTATHRVFNIRNNKPEKLMTFIQALEDAISNKLGKDVEFEKVCEPIKLGDVPAKYAPTELLQERQLESN